LRLHKQTASLAGVLFLLFVAALVASKYAPLNSHKLSEAEQQRLDAAKSKRAAAAAFAAMTPAQHIERAKVALRPGATTDAIDEGLRNVRAIPASAPESHRAQSLEADLSRARNLTVAETLIDAAPNSDLKDGLDKLDRASAIVQTLKQQNPADSDATKLTRSAAAAAEQLAIRAPEEFAASKIKLADFSWEKGGFGTVMMANFTFRNDSPTDVGDLKIHCEHHDANGVLLDENEGTAFGIVKAHSSSRMTNVNMGFLSAQTSRSPNTKTNCEIVNLKPASQSVMYHPPR
jgi:hypothetical protein